MGSAAHQLHVLFLPLMSPGHIIPMTDIAKLFSQRGVKATIITTPVNASLIQNTITRATSSGHHIKLHLIKFPTAECGLPDGCENINFVTSAGMMANFMKAICMLEQPMEQVIRQLLPNCIVSDMFYPWTADFARELHIPRLIFHGTSFFSLCFVDGLIRYAPQEKVASDSEPFIVPGLPHLIETTRSQLPIYYKIQSDFSYFIDRIRESELKSYGVLVNSFYEMEPAYADHYKKSLGKKAWHIGPVSLCNRDDIDKAERWNMASIEQAECLSWLDSMEPCSVVYVCFGSLAMLQTSQLLEIAMGLESSNRPFIWVVRAWQDSKDEGEWLPRGFEGRIKEKGLIIRGWAPQILILDHPAIGGFVTHCGWNSTIEGVTARVPMITWPISGEQFDNEKLIVQVAKFGIKIGVGTWRAYGEEGMLVKREEIARAVERLMDGGEEAEEIRKRVKELGEKAKRAVEEGGSSNIDMGLLINELITCRIAQHKESLGDRESSTIVGQCASDLPDEAPEG